MIDLHTHTTYSDGTWSVIELLKHAEDKGVTLLSITDHDTVDAYLEMKNLDITKYFSGKIVIGGEFNAFFDKAKIELLGYDFDIDKLKEWLDKTHLKSTQKANYQKEFDLLISACHKHDIKISADLKYKEGYPIGIIYDDIKLYKENKDKFDDRLWNNKDYFVRCCMCDEEFDLYLDLSYQTPSAKEVSTAIKKAGGKVFLAHLYTYPLSDYIGFLDELVKENIVDGVEVYYSNFNSEQIRVLEKYCQENDLYMSGGSDCHGDKKRDRQIGTGYGNMNVPESEILKWTELS